MESKYPLNLFQRWIQCTGFGNASVKAAVRVCRYQIFCNSFFKQLQKNFPPESSDTSFNAGHVDYVMPIVQGALNTDLGLRRLIDRFLVYYRDRDSWGASRVAELVADLVALLRTLALMQVTFSTVCIRHRYDQLKQWPVHVRRRRQTLSAHWISCRHRMRWHMGEIP